MVVQNPPANAGDLTRDPGSLPGLGSSPGEGNGNPLQYSYLENPMDRGTWCVIPNTGEARDVNLIPGSGRSLGVGNDNPLQYSCVENSMDRGARWAVGHGVTKSRMQLSTLT